MSEAWVTPESFSALRDRTLVLALGEARIEIRRPEFHLHRIDGVTPAHRHPEHQILYYLTGHGTQTIERERLAVEPHTVFFIPPQCAHRFEPQGRAPAKALTLQFAAELPAGGADRAPETGGEDFARLAHLLYDTRRLRRVRLDAEAAREAAEWTDRLQEELALNRFGMLLAVQGWLMLLLRLFLEAGVKREAAAPPMTRAQLSFLRATDLVRRRMDAAVSLASLAAECHVSPSTLQKIFRRSLGRPVSRFIQETKMEHAAHLLRTTDLPVKAVAAACGIADRRYFTRLFRSRLGTGPREYRARR